MIESLKNIRDWQPGRDLNDIINEMLSNTGVGNVKSWTTDRGVILLLENAWELNYRVTVGHPSDGTYGWMVRWDHDTYPEGEAQADRLSVAMALALLDTFVIGVPYDDPDVGQKVQALAERYRTAL